MKSTDVFSAKPSLGCLPNRSPAFCLNWHGKGERSQKAAVWKMCRSVWELKVEILPYFIFCLKKLAAINVEVSQVSTTENCGISTYKTKPCYLFFGRKNVFWNVEFPRNYVLKSHVTSPHANFLRNYGNARLATSRRRRRRCKKRRTRTVSFHDLDR